MCNPEGGDALVEEGVPLEIQLLWFCVRMQWCSFYQVVLLRPNVCGVFAHIGVHISGCNVKLVAAGSTVAVWG